MKLSKKARQGIAIFNSIKSNNPAYSAATLTELEKAERDDKRFSKMRSWEKKLREKITKG